MCFADLMCSSFEDEKNGKLYFLAVEVSREGNKFATTVYRKPTFNSVYAPLDSFFYLLQINVFQFVPTGLTFVMI